MKFVTGEMKPSNPALTAFIVLLGQIENDDDNNVYEEYEVEVKINGHAIDFEKLIERYNAEFHRMVDDAARTKVVNILVEKSEVVNELLEKIEQELTRLI